jgi:hypothetical protein
MISPEALLDFSKGYLPLISVEISMPKIKIENQPENL